MTLAPLSLKDAPAFIERQFPVGRLSAEAYKERKAVAGQTLTALGSYWKGRKPLILCRAVTLGCLLPATDDDVADLEIFLALMAMDDAAFGRRWDDSASAFTRLAPDRADSITTSYNARRVKLKRPKWRDDVGADVREACIAEALAVCPYEVRLEHVLRPEECEEALLLGPIWSRVNAHLGTTAGSLVELVKELGVARFGHRPRVSDTFCGGGSIPFEAARIGCDVRASDLNPVACMLTWGAFNIVGASRDQREEIARSQEAVAKRVDAEITELGVEHDAAGNRAKAYLYCLETRCPRTGWMVPMSPSWVIAPKHGVMARLVPNSTTRNYRIEIVTGASAAEMAQAEKGTIRDKRLVHPMNPDKSGVEIRVIRGDRPGGGNALRLWSKADFMPHPDDIWRERLYCVQWIEGKTFDQPQPTTFFRTVAEDDIARERQVERLVRENLGDWQAQGLVPDTQISPGAKTDEPIRTRGWTYWHHLFGARALLVASIVSKHSRLQGTGVAAIYLADAAETSGKLSRWVTSQASGGGGVKGVFNNQALNTLYNYGVRSFANMSDGMSDIGPRAAPVAGIYEIECSPANRVDNAADVFITDPPYADAVRYEEITEFFIGWLRKSPPTLFDGWTWDSRRDLAIKGQDADFRRSMVEAYAAMTSHLLDNGLQVVMFTHQDAGVWADLAGILWASGLRVTAAWNIVTETESALKAGNYVQGTVCLVLRKRLGGGNARRMEIESEIEDEVKAQLAGLTTLDTGWTTATGGETLYTDGDLTLAAYAAALRVVTAYATIDRRDVGTDVFREVKKGEKTPLRQLIDYAASVANRELVPRDFPPGAWRDLESASRFYVRMLDMEARGNPKVADFQNFAKSFALADYAALMGSTAANAASLAGAAFLKGKPLRDPVLARQPLFQLLFAVWKTIEKNDPKVGATHLRTELGADYWTRRAGLAELADYVVAKTEQTRPDESAAAAELAEALRVDRI